MLRADCPKCGKWAEGFDVISIIFGVRRINNKYFPQSYCKACRRPHSGIRYCLWCRQELINLKKGLLFCGFDCKLAFRRFRREELKNQTLNHRKVVKTSKIDILEGLTDKQKEVIKAFVYLGYHPLGFSVDVKNDAIWYMGKRLK